MESYAQREHARLSVCFLVRHLNQTTCGDPRDFNRRVNSQDNGVKA
jgi:hypothetical protein